MAENPSWVAVAGTLLGAAVGMAGQIIAATLKNRSDQKLLELKEQKDRQAAETAKYGKFLAIAVELDLPGHNGDNMIEALGKLKQFLLDNPEWLLSERARVFFMKYFNGQFATSLRTLTGQALKDEVEQFRKEVIEVFTKSEDKK